jgi:disulfide bond formation protein DsbB
MKKIFSDNRALARIFFVLAAIPLALALASQYIGHLKPCHLCIWQRIPYFIILVFSIIAIAKSNIKIFLTTTIITIHAFLIDAGIAVYHVGVEKHWWVNSDCSSTLNMSSFEALRTSILNTPAVACDQVQFEFLGVSMAGWNFVYAISASLFSILLLYKYMKLKPATIDVTE